MLNTARQKIIPNGRMNHSLLPRIYGKKISFMCIYRLASLSESIVFIGLLNVKLSRGLARLWCCTIEIASKGYRQGGSAIWDCRWWDQRQRLIYWYTDTRASIFTHSTTCSNNHHVKILSYGRSYFWNLRATSITLTLTFNIPMLSVCNMHNLPRKSFNEPRFNR